MGNCASRHKSTDEEQREDSEENREDEGRGGACSETSCHEEPPVSAEPEERQDSATLASGPPSEDDGGCTSSQELSEEEREEIRLSLTLCCADTAEIRSLKFPVGLSTSVKDLKNTIQSELSIPVPCQKIYFESALLLDYDSLRYCRIRDGDVLHVHYNSEADVDEILSAVNAMRDMLTFIQSMQPALANHKKYTPELDHQIQAAINHQTLHSLASSCFNLSFGERYRANVVLFTSSGGIDLLSQLYKLTHKYQWQYTPVSLQQLESALLSLLWKISATAPTRVIFLRYPLHDCVIQSALRGAVRPNKGVRAPIHMLPIEAKFMQDALLCKVIGKALGTLCKYVSLSVIIHVVHTHYILIPRLAAGKMGPAYVTTVIQAQSRFAFISLVLLLLFNTSLRYIANLFFSLNSHT